MLLCECEYVSVSMQVWVCECAVCECENDYAYVSVCMWALACKIYYVSMSTTPMIFKNIFLNIPPGRVMLKKIEQLFNISAGADGGPHSRVCAC